MPRIIPTPFFYGWVIVVFTFTMQFVAVGLSYYSFSVFLKPLTEALEVDRFLISITMSIQSGVIGILSPLAGKWFSQLRIRYLMTAGVACMSIAFLSLSQITAVWQLWLLFGGLTGAGSVLLGAIPSNLLLANWFYSKRGTALGIAQFGITISGSVLVPAITWVVLNQGWETAFAYCGIGAAIILTPLIWLLAIRTPEEVGLYPDGAEEPPPAESRPGDAEPWTFRRALRTRDIWLITFAVGPCYMGIGAVILVLPSHITDLGISAMQAGWVITVTTLFGALAKPIFGTLSDYLNKKVVFGGLILLQATGVALFIGAESLFALYVAGAFFGLGYGGVSPLWGVMLATRFGRASFAQVMGANQPMLMVFNLIGFPLANLVFEQTGSYLPAFYGLLGVYLVALLAISAFSLHDTTKEPAHVEAET